MSIIRAVIIEIEKGFVFTFVMVKFISRILSTASLNSFRRPIIHIVLSESNSVTLQPLNLFRKRKKEIQ